MRNIFRMEKYMEKETFSNDLSYLRNCNAIANQITFKLLIMCFLAYSLVYLTSP